MRIVKALFVASLALLGACDSNETDMGPLTSIIQSSSESPWLVQNNGDSVLMENQNESGAIRYYYASLSEGEEGRRTISVELDFSQSQTDSLAGLLYGLELDPKSYFLFTAVNDQSVGLYLKGNNGFNEIMKFSVDNFTPEKIRLVIQERGNSIALFVNGTEKSTYSSNRTGRGAVGIVAAGKGTFQFSHFDVELTGAIEHDDINTESDGKVAILEKAQDRPLSTQRQDLTLQDLYDKQNGMVKTQFPFPNGWRFVEENTNNLFMVGPNNIEVYTGNVGHFVYSDDPFTLESARRAGGNIARPLSLEQFARQQHSQYLSQQGFSLINTYPLPKVNNVYELVSAGMPQGLSQRRSYSLGAEWERQDGTRVFSIFVKNVTQKGALTVWGVQYSDMYSSSEDFEQAKANFRYAVENQELNPQYQIFKNNELLENLKRNAEKWATRTAQAQAAHLRRMNAILARSKSSSSIAKINSDILDINHAGYLKRSNMVSAGQANTIGTLNETSIIANPTTGEHYRVEAGANNYWVNNRGIVFNTENSLIDPRTDINISDQQWERFDVVR